jgi:hypothetical protein
MTTMTATHVSPHVVCSLHPAQVSCSTARAIVLLASEILSADDSDAMQLRVTLLLIQYLEAHSEVSRFDAPFSKNGAVSSGIFLDNIARQKSSCSIRAIIPFAVHLF